MTVNVFKLKISFLVTVFAFLFSNSVLAQKPKNRIILWDVTQSMVGSTNNQPPNFGYNPSTDIDKKVRAALVSIVDSTKDDEGSFKICPFGTDIWEYKDFPNTASGRSDLKTYINNYKIGKEPKGYTNICAAWDKAMGFIDSKKQNLIILFTDGQQNIAYGPTGKECLATVIEKYCQLTHGSDTYTFYVSLNLVDNTFKDSKCANVIYVPVNSKGNDPVILPIPLALAPKYKPLTFNVQDNASSFERFEIIAGDSKKLTNINCSLELVGQYKLGVKSKISGIKEGFVDVNFILDDLDGKEINNLKSIKNLNITGTIKLTPVTNEINSPSVEIPINIINKKAPQLNFIIK